MAGPRVRPGHAAAVVAVRGTVGEQVLGGRRGRPRAGDHAARAGRGLPAEEPATVRRRSPVVHAWSFPVTPSRTSCAESGGCRVPAEPRPAADQRIDRGRSDRSAIGGETGRSGQASTERWRKPLARARRTSGHGGPPVVGTDNGGRARCAVAGTRRVRGALLWPAMLRRRGWLPGAAAAAALLATALVSAPADAGTWDAAVRLNQLQSIGSHNSYHLEAPKVEADLRALIDPAGQQALEYAHLPLQQQFSAAGGAADRARRVGRPERLALREPAHPLGHQRRPVRAGDAGAGHQGAAHPGHRLPHHVPHARLVPAAR